MARWGEGQISKMAPKCNETVKKVKSWVLAGFGGVKNWRFGDIGEVESSRIDAGGCVTLSSTIFYPSMEHQRGEATYV